jgi:Xaa-Pro aminopeptidase
VLDALPAADESMLKVAVQRRIAELRRRMAAQGADVAVFYSSGVHTFLLVDQVRYVSGFKCMGPDAVVVLPKDDPPTLLVSPVWDADRARRQSPIEDVVATPDVPAALRRLVGERRLAAAAVVVTGLDRITASAREALVDSFRSPLRSFDASFDEVAAIRDNYELALARQAARIADEANEHLLATATAGMPEYVLAAELVRFTKSRGADDNFLLLASSQHNRGVRPVSDRLLDRGDFVISELTPSVGGQFVQINRTAVLGEPTPQQHTAYDVLSGALQAGLSRAVAGATVGEMVGAVNDMISAAGHGSHLTGRRRGHGLGLGSVVPGDLVAGNDTVLRPGMIFTLHPNQYLPATGYLMCGQPVLVTEHGPEVLSARDSLSLDVVAV